MAFIDLHEDIVTHVVLFLDQLDPLIAFYSTSKQRHSTIAPYWKGGVINPKFLFLLNNIVELNLDKLPKILKAVLSTLPDPSSLKITRSFWPKYVGGLVKSGLLDGTLANEWDILYNKCNQFYQSTPNPPHHTIFKPDGTVTVTYLEPNVEMAVEQKLQHIPSQVHREVGGTFLRNLIRCPSLEHFTVMYQGDEAPHGMFMMEDQVGWFLGLVRKYS